MKKLGLLLCLTILITSCSTKYIIMTKNCNDNYCEYEIVNCNKYSSEFVQSSSNYSEGSYIKIDKSGNIKETKCNCL